MSEILHKKAFELWGEVGRALAGTFGYSKVEWSEEERKLLEKNYRLLARLVAQLYLKLKEEKRR